MMSLSVKYRPKTFDEVVSQVSTVKILKQQLETHTFSNVYLLCGPSGNGKTTLARIFANELNENKGTPIEVDGASNNGVDNIRTLIDESKTRAIDSEYKVIIIDEAHMLTVQAWNAFLKCIEEPPKYTVFIFCTTDPQKIPETVLNRMMRFNLSKISSNKIKERLLDVCEKEHYQNYAETCDFISRICNGCMRDSLSLLQKCASYDVNLKIENALEAIGNFSYDIYLKLINSLVDGNQKEVISIVEQVYNSGKDLKTFVEQFLNFTLDLNKYCLFKDINVTQIPVSIEKPKFKGDTNCVLYATAFEDSTKYFNKLSSALLDLKTSLKYDTMPRTTVEIKFINICRGIL